MLLRRVTQGTRETFLDRHIKRRIAMTSVTVNGRRYDVDLPDDTPLLWALHGRGHRHARGDELQGRPGGAGELPHLRAPAHGGGAAGDSRAHHPRRLRTAHGR